MKSMTGYGFGENEVFAVHIKSLNHRFLDVNIKIPQKFLILEELVRRNIEERIKRGRIFVYIMHKQDLEIKEESIRKVFEQVKRIFEGVSITINLTDLLKEDIFFLQPQDKWWEDLHPPLECAIEALLNTKKEEGRRLRVQIMERMENLKNIHRLMEECIKEEIEKLKTHIKESVKQLLEYPLSEERLYNECAILSVRHDVSEELDRIKSHLEELYLLSQMDECGKQMDFFIQEINRELSTITSKAVTIKLKKLSLQARMECEKIKEQIQNIE